MITHANIETFSPNFKKWGNFIFTININNYDSIYYKKQKKTPVTTCFIDISIELAAPK